VDGTLSAPVIDIQGGTLSGSGHIVGSVHNGGSISPGHSPGLLEIEGDYVQLSEATLIMQLGGLAAGTEYDLLQIGGNAALDGTLNLELWDGFHPSDGNLFTILTFLSRGGSRFATVNGLQIAGGHFDLAYNAQDVTLRFAADPTPEPGTVVLWIGGLAALAWLRRRY
jgi:hypothetical protein